ncbi:MAG: sulfite exporter TauE/SafE family protein [Planctomycetes bacterium]|nr:sulfite exporter TauE/SafE family protein [Planctomycetota bacterium]
MGTLLVAVFVASLAGSLHCVGMCGGLIAFVAGSGASGAGKRASVRRRSLMGVHVVYHSSRAVTYVLLGVTAGVVGAAVDFSGSALGWGRAAVILAGATMVLFGVLAFLRNFEVRLPRLGMPKFLSQAFARGHRLAVGRGPIFRAALVGGLTAALPCGWLYAFVLTAASTSHPLSGAMVMLAFWMGTVPVLLGVGLGAQQLAAPLAKHLPKVAPLVLVAVGLSALTGRFTPPTFAGKMPIAASPEAVKELVQQVPPCCAESPHLNEQAEPFPDEE